jgi:hypothetical protein
MGRVPVAAKLQAKTGTEKTLFMTNEPILKTQKNAITIVYEKDYKNTRKNGSKKTNPFSRYSITKKPGTVDTHQLNKAFFFKLFFLLRVQ